MCIPCVTASNEIAALFSLNEMLVGGQFFSVFFFSAIYACETKTKLKKKSAQHLPQEKAKTQIRSVKALLIILKMPFD